MGDWDQKQYAKFANERTQPSVDLLSRIDITPRTILDVGCGDGNSTGSLLARFPDADIVGIDSSDSMLAAATRKYPQLEFIKCNVPDDLDKVGQFDLIFSNACLHWIPDHESLLPKLVLKLNEGGVLAVQMPLVMCAPFYKALGELVAEKEWQDLRRINNFHNLSSEKTYDILCRCASDVTMWETNYFHLVSSHEQVIEWYKGSGLKPYLDCLDKEREQRFKEQLLTVISRLFPVRADNRIFLKMPRMFFTAKK